MKFSPSTALALACIALSSMSVHALPAARQNEPTEKNIGDLMGSALAKWLASQSVKDFRAIQGGKQVNWVGETVDVPQEAGNAVLFNTADRVVADSKNGTESFFADAYKVFIQDLTSKLGLDAIEESDELKQRGEDRDTKCGDNIANVTETITEELLERARKRNPDITPTNAQINTAVQKEARWKSANADCVSADQAYSALYDKEHGFNFALFAQASKNIRPLADALPQVVPGITMAASSEALEAAGDDPFTSPSGQGDILPLYNIPALAATVTGWQARADDAEPEFSWDSTSEQTHTLSELQSSSASVGVSFGRFGGKVGASSTEQTETSSITAQSFSVKFGGIALIDLYTGRWFDAYRTAHQAENPPDEKSQPAKEVFAAHFGDASNPKPASRYNKQIVVAYKPTWEMKFSNSESYHKFLESSWEASASYLFFDASASGKKMSDVVDKKDDSNTASYKPTSKTAVILGYVVENYFNNKPS